MLAASTVYVSNTKTVEGYEDYTLHCSLQLK